MKYISLFTGIGGFDIAFTEAGMECVAQVEIDVACNRLLELRFPEVRRFTDVREVGKHNLLPADLVCGGFPCQDLSVAGKRAGLAGERSGLWFEFARVIDELEPQWVVIENVPGLLSSDRGKDFAVIVQWLAERGYGVCWRILDAQYFGVPQRRRRVFIIGSFRDGRAAEVLFERESSPRDTAPNRETGERVARTIAGGSTKCHSDINSGQQDNNFIIQALQARDYKGIGSQYVDENKLVAVGHSGGATIKINDIANTINAQTGSETTAMFNGAMYWNASRRNGFEISDNISSTLQGFMGTGGNNVPMVGVRRLTPTECERLQGFPDGYTAGQSDSVRYRQLGNAVAVPVIKWIAKRIMRVNETDVIK